VRPELLEGGPSVGGGRKLLLVHQFELPSVSGVTVMVAELLRLIPAVDPETDARCQSYQGFGAPGALVAALRADHADTDCVVGINLHIEVGWDFTLELLRWCGRGGQPFYLHVHDYWPHHRDRMTVLTGEYGARLLAITPDIAGALMADGFPAALLPVGVAVGERPAGRPTVPAAAMPRTVASVGRLVPRKRFPDVVRAFCHAGLDAAASLYLRVPPSLVYPPEQDRVRLQAILAASRDCGAVPSIHVDDSPRLGTDYSRWAAYVCASEYEGVSMTPIEAVLQGCPPLLSDIPPHRALVDALFPGRAGEFVFPVGSHVGLAGLLRDEILTGRRRAEIAERQHEIHEQVERRWSLRTAARALANLAKGIDTEGEVVAR
jgi:glycosyltransferase involved in cell wall biosynthesis